MDSMESSSVELMSIALSTMDVADIFSSISGITLSMLISSIYLPGVTEVTAKPLSGVELLLLQNVNRRE